MMYHDNKLPYINTCQYVTLSTNKNLSNAMYLELRCCLENIKKSFSNSLSFQFHFH